jgi:hypothetical protein
MRTFAKKLQDIVERVESVKQAEKVLEEQDRLCRRAKYAKEAIQKLTKDMLDAAWRGAKMLQFTVGESDRQHEPECIVESIQEFLDREEVQWTLDKVPQHSDAWVNRGHGYEDDTHYPAKDWVDYRFKISWEYNGP